MKKSVLILIGILILAAALRLWRINSVPVSLFGDELDVGYQAYSILKTGKDYSGISWPLHFHSLAEWRTPLYLYSSVPTVALFGISPLGVRLPAALFGIASIYGFYLLARKATKDEKLALIGAFLLAISPWHIQYSRSGFEVTQLLFFLIFGIYFFLASLEKKGKYLWASGICLALTPWVYSTAKLFTPLLILFLVFLFSKEIKRFSLKNIILGIFALIIVGAPIGLSTLFGGGAQRFGYISVFTDPTIEPEVGTARQLDAYARDEKQSGISPTIVDKIFHNKVNIISAVVSRNYLQALSSDFLFQSGDPNPRHSIDGMGEFYKVDIILLIVGVILFFKEFKNTKVKYLVAFWIIVGILPAALTRDGGNHATRLIIILPPLMLLAAYGLKEILQNLKNKNLHKLLFLGYSLGLLFCFVSYQHLYWVHNPIQSERWWHYGYEDAIKAIKKIDTNYDRVVISTANEPPWIFFAGWYEYPPSRWQAGYPFKKTNLKGFGEISYLDKFYFGSPQGGVYDWGPVLDNKTLYLATAKEVNVNLIREPERTPKDLMLLKAIAYPSGEPAYYLFTKK